MTGQQALLEANSAKNPPYAAAGYAVIVLMLLFVITSSLLGVLGLPGGDLFLPENFDFAIGVNLDTLIAGILFAVAYSLLLTFLMRQVLPYLRTRPNTYRLFEDRLELHFKEGRVMTVPLDAIEAVHFFRKPPARIFAFTERESIRQFAVSGMWVYGADRTGVIRPDGYGSGAREGEIHIRFVASRGEKGAPRKIVDVALGPEDPLLFFHALTRSIRARMQREEETPPLNQSPLFEAAPQLGAELILTSLHPMSLISLWATIIVVYLFIAIRQTLGGRVAGEADALLLFAFIAGAFFAIFYWVIPYLVKRRTYPELTFQFFEDQIVCPETPTADIPRPVPLSAILRVRALRSPTQALLGLGTIEIATTRITGVNSLGLAETTVTIPDVKNPREIADKIRALLPKS